MAKRSGGPNKSQAIREYLDSNPNAKPREIVDALKAQGLSVTAAFVSTIKSKAAGSDGPKVTKRRGRPKGAGRKAVTSKTRAPKAAAAPVTRRGASSESVSVDGLVAAKKLVDQLGGLAKARAALSALEKITG